MDKDTQKKTLFVVTGLAALLAQVLPPHTVAAQVVGFIAMLLGGGGYLSAGLKKPE